MSSLFSIIVGVISVLNAFRIKYLPESARIRKPFRLFSLWNREPFSAKGWKSKYYEDVLKTLNYSSFILSIIS